MRALPLLLSIVFIYTAPRASTAGPNGDSNLADAPGEQATIPVSGKVIAASDKLGLPGVSILIKGTQQGTVTDIDGNFNLKIPANSTLVFSFIGFKTQEVAVDGKNTISVIMEESIEAMEEVVVTALGITRKEKSLGYSVGEVKGDDLTKVAQENAINSLAGKVSGVQINSTGGTGSSVSMVIRGATSLTSDNQPLFVIDGVPVANSLNNIGGFGGDNKVDYGNAMSDLNANDIESISILKGPSAAALYGSRAGNGVVLITTKSGRRNKGGMKVNISSNTVFDMPYKYYAVCKKFANGQLSYTPEDMDGETLVVDPSIYFGAGIELDKEYFAIQWDSPYDANGYQIPTELVSHPNNVANFVETGLTTTNSVSVSNNSEFSNYRIGVTNMTSKGIIPNSDLNRNSLTAATSLKVRKNFTLSSNININKSWADNRPSTANRGANPMQWAYRVPQNTDIRVLEDYWEEGQEGLQQKVPYIGEYNNPYFIANEINNSFERNRVYGNLKADWQITKELSFMGRYSLDQYTEKQESKIAPSYTEEPNNGAYGIKNISRYERNIDVLLTFAKDFSDFSSSISVGGNALYSKSSSTSNSSSSGSGLIAPNVYTLSNIKSGSLSYSSAWSQKAMYSVYALANLGWKDMVFVDLTARNDWSSTLPSSNRSYFYPSASLSLLINQMVDMGDNISLFKLRGGWAQVGNDTDPYQLYNTYGNAGQWGNAVRFSKSGQILTPDLKPEIATSIEFGTDLGFFKNRLRIAGTYYEVQNENQIINNIPVASSSGYSSTSINAGLIESKGWELSFGGTPLKSRIWNWDINVNFTRNRTWVKEISEGIDVIELWSDAKTGAWAYVGDQLGSIYDAKVVRVEDENSPYYGYPILNEEYEWDGISFDDTKHKVGNYNPNFLMGIQSSLSYKNFTLSFSIDWRNGGQFLSQTERYMAEDSMSETWLGNTTNPEGRSGTELRNWLVANEDKLIKNGFHVIGGPSATYGAFEENVYGTGVKCGVLVPGVFDNGDGTYTENLGEDGSYFVPYLASYPWDFGTPSIFDADMIKLREISLSYSLPQNLLDKVGDIENFTVSVYSRNIMLWTKAKIGVDPERAFQAESSSGNMRGTQFKQGIERYNLEPWVFPIGVKLDLTF